MLKKSAYNSLATQLTYCTLFDWLSIVKPFHFHGCVRDRDDSAFKVCPLTLHNADAPHAGGEDWSLRCHLVQVVLLTQVAPMFQVSELARLVDRRRDNFLGT